MRTTVVALLNILSLNLNFLTPALASFSLDTQSAHWFYTSANLAITTSAKCKEAYSAKINCDPALLELATSTSLTFESSDADLKSVCTSSCQDSLSDYVTNLGATCRAQGDIATQDFGGGRMLADRVFAVGNNLEYVYAQSCSKDSQNHYCRLSPNKPPPPSCTSPCTIQYYSNINQFKPASFKRFNTKHQFSNHSDTWKQHFNASYEKIQACGGKNGAAGANSLFPGISTLPKYAQGLIASATGDGADLGGYVPVATGTGSSSPVVTTGAGPDQTGPSTTVITFASEAGRLGSNLWVQWLLGAWIVSVALFGLLL